MPRAPSKIDTSPVSESEFAVLMRPFAPFEAQPHLAVAVSGGRDSRALVLLARQWTSRRGGKIAALVVDHGLRPEAAAEAEQTRVWLAARGIEAHVLHWQPPSHLRAGLQAAARTARYRLLLDWCARHGVLHLLTAHQADDQAETYALRAARDSGPAGLAAMSALVEFPEARLLRPLLPVTRARLTATLQGRAQTWIDDPSNSNPRFARGQLRRDGLPMPPAAALRRAAEFAQRRVADESEITDALARCAMPHPLGAALIDHALWRGLPVKWASSVLASVIVTVAGAAYPPRRQRTQRAVAQMRAVGLDPDRPPAGMTLGGCRILWRGGHWLVVREPATIRPGGWDREARAGRWDGRFEIFAGSGMGRRVTEGDWAALAAVAGSAQGWEKAWPATAGLPAVLAALPCRGAGDRWLPLPIDGGFGPVTQRPQAGRRGFKACFRPLQPLAAGPFFPCFATAKGQIVN